VRPAAVSLTVHSALTSTYIPHQVRYPNVCLVRDEEAAGSNPATPTQVRRYATPARPAHRRETTSRAVPVVCIQMVSRAACTTARCSSAEVCNGYGLGRAPYRGDMQFCYMQSC
jgi:hypothetical protein